MEYSSTPYVRLSPKKTCMAVIYQCKFYFCLKISNITQLEAFQSDLGTFWHTNYNIK